MASVRMRAATAGALAVGLAVTAAPMANALPVQDVRQGTDLWCTGQPSPTEYLELYSFLPSSGGLTESFAAVYTEELQAWAYEGEGSLESDGDFSVSFTFVTDAGAPVGSMTVDGTVVEPLGDPMTLADRYRDGNAWSTVEGTVQELVVTGSVTEATGDVSSFEGTELGCGGSAVDIVFRGSNPATRIYRSTGGSAQCPIGEDGFLGVDTFGETTYGTLALGIDWDTGTADLVAQGELENDGDTIAGTLDVIEPPSDPAGTVAVELTIGPELDSGSFRFKWRQGAYRERFTDYLLAGSATLPDGTVVAIEDCQFREFSSMERFSSRAGQKPGGRPPVNDEPDGALPLAEGATVRASTRGAAEAPEAACLLLVPGEAETEVPLGRTVWYQVDGTGGDVTLSTVGSDFDTVIGVYESGSLDPVACVDDTPETGLQASVAFATTAGTTYLVQVGGFAADWGRLVLSRT